MMFKSESLPKSWKTGPTSDVQLLPNHGRSILCVAMQGDQVVTGSADHGLRVYSLSSGKQMKQLYTKAYGHKEWVTSVVYCPNGKILSASMDKYMCLWEARAVRCTNLQAHNASVSKVMVDQNNIAISGSYDRSLLIWDLNKGSCEAGLFDGHDDAVMAFDWKNSLCVSADRKGGVSVWDINAAKPITISKPHKGQLSQVKLYSDGVDQNLYMTAGTFDGLLVVSDMRTSAPVFKKQLHKQAINMLDTSLSSLIVTGSGDSSIKILDIMGGFKTVGDLQTTDAVFCGKVVQNLAVVGCGDGNILVYNLDTQDCQFGFGADPKGPVHCLQVSEDNKKLVAGGESGTGLLMKF